MNRRADTSDEAKTAKIPYKAPKLVVYGSIAKLTAAKQSGSNRDGVGNKRS